MRFSQPAVASIAVLLLAGCGTAAFQDRVRARFAAVPPTTVVLAVDARKAFDAVQTAFKRLDYTLVRVSPAGLSVEAASRINSSVVFRDSVQLRAGVTVSEAGPGRSEVALRVFELREGPGLGGAGEVERPGHGFHAAFFAALHEVLAESTAGAPPVR